MGEICNNISATFKYLVKLLTLLLFLRVCVTASVLFSAFFWSFKEQQSSTPVEFVSKGSPELRRR